MTCIERTQAEPTNDKTTRGVRTSEETALGSAFLLEKFTKKNKKNRYRLSSLDCLLQRDSACGTVLVLLVQLQRTRALEVEPGAG